MEPIILFRHSIREEEEFSAAKQYFQVVESRSLCKNNLVIPRYSALPYYKELETDLKENNCQLINSYKQHQWIADFEYYEDLKEFTPQSWNQDNFSNSTYPGPFVVKGKTNSKKHKWNTHMFAVDRNAANKIASELRNDMLIGEQDVIYRQYVPLKTFEVGINGVRFANEWRFFYYKTNKISHGFYWSIMDDLSLPYINDEALELADKIAKIASEKVNFFVMDIAEKEEGGWVLIEMNCGTMSGLSLNDPHVFYSNLAKQLKD